MQTNDGMNIQLSFCILTSIQFSSTDLESNWEFWFGNGFEIEIVAKVATELKTGYSFQPKEHQALNNPKGKKNAKGYQCQISTMPR